jgi:hypothetical protein
MSSSISFLPSLISGLFSSSSSSTTGSILGVVYGTGTSATNSLGQNPVTALNNAEKDETQEVKATAEEPSVARDIAAFTQAVQTATSPQQLLDNPTVLKVLLTANGLGDQVSYTALAQKALLSNSNDSNSLANTLSDTEWKSTAETYDFANKGLSIIQNPQVISTIANAYAEVKWRQSLDATTPGLSNALTFRSEASSVTTVDQILGDPILRSVVTTTLGIPEQIAYQPLEAQEKAITNRLDISKLQDPQFVESFAQKYLITMAGSSSSSSTTSPGLTSLAVQSKSLIV